MSSPVCGIDGVAVTVGVGLLVQVGVAADEAPNLRVVEPAPHQGQPRVALRPVAARGPELVGARAAPRAGDGLPEGRGRQRPLDGPAAVGDGALGAEAVEQRRFPTPIGELLCIAWSQCYVSVTREQGPLSPKPREEDAPQPQVHPEDRHPWYESLSTYVSPVNRMMLHPKA